MLDQNQREPVIEPLLITIPEAAKAIGVSRAKLYRMLPQEKDLEIIRFGRSVRISVKSLKSWLEKRQNDIHSS